MRRNPTNLITSIASMQEPEQRINAYAALLGDHPDYAPLRFNLAMDYFKRQQMKQASEQARHAVQISPSMWGILPFALRLSAWKSLQRSQRPTLTIHPPPRGSRTTSRVYQIKRLISSSSQTALFDASEKSSKAQVTLRMWNRQGATHEPDSPCAKQVPGCVYTREVVWDSSGYPFQVLPRTLGRVLTDPRLKRARSPEVAIEIVRKAALILHKLHEARCIYAVIHPESVLYDDLQFPPRVHLLDIEKAISLEEDTEQWKNPWGDWQGAPELGTSQPTRVQTDVYGLGVLLYYAFTGKGLVGGATPDAQTIRGYFPARWREREDLAALLTEVARIIERAVLLSPDARYCSAHEFAEALPVPRQSGSVGSSTPVAPPAAPIPAGATPVHEWPPVQPAVRTAPPSAATPRPAKIPEGVPDAATAPVSLAKRGGTRSQVAASPDPPNHPDSQQAKPDKPDDPQSQTRAQPAPDDPLLPKVDLRKRGGSTSQATAASATPANPLPQKVSLRKRGGTKR